MTFGEYLHKARKAAGFSLRDLGELINLSVPYLHDLEYDRRRLACGRWASLAVALPGVTLEGLINASVETDIKSGLVTVDIRGASEWEIETVARLLKRAAEKGASHAND